jgi:hypothetical protein
MPEAASAPHGVAVSPEVAQFAVKHGLAQYLPRVTDLTRRIYPGREITIHLEADAEIPDDWCIMLDVDVTDLDAGHIADTQWQWCSDVFNHCPATHVHYFRLGIVVTP